MGQAAYDMNAVRRRRAPQTRKNVPLRVEKGGKRRRHQEKAGRRKENARVVR